MKDLQKICTKCSKKFTAKGNTKTQQLNAMSIFFHWQDKKAKTLRAQCRSCTNKAARDKRLNSVPTNPVRRQVTVESADKKEQPILERIPSNLDVYMPTKNGNFV